MTLQDSAIFLRLLKEEGLCHTYPGDTHANFSRLLANLSWLIRKSAGDRPKSRRRRFCAGIGDNGDLLLDLRLLALDQRAKITRPSATHPSAPNPLPALCHLDTTPATIYIYVYIAHPTSLTYSHTHILHILKEPAGDLKNYG